MKEKQFDIIFIQESHAETSDKSLWRSQWSGEIHFSNYSRAARGVMTLFKRNIAAQVKFYEKDEQGRVVCSIVKTDNEAFICNNIYAPNQDNPDFFLKIGHRLNNAKLDKHILAGDFNLVLDLELDKLGGSKTTHKNSVKVIETLMEQFNLNNVWRIQNPEKRQFTYTQKQPRIECILVSGELMKAIPKTSIVPGYRSDHKIVFMTYDTAPLKKGPGFWRFNNSLLKDEQYCKEAIEIIVKYKKEKYASTTAKWDFIKM